MKGSVERYDCESFLCRKGDIFLHFLAKNFYRLTDSILLFDEQNVFICFSISLGGGGFVGAFNYKFRSFNFFSVIFFFWLIGYLLKFFPLFCRFSNFKSMLVFYSIV